MLKFWVWCLVIMSKEKGTAVSGVGDNRWGERGTERLEYVDVLLCKL